jgi:hypothetical protein
MTYLSQSENKASKAVALLLPRVCLSLLNGLMLLAVVLLLLSPARAHAQAFVNGSITGTVQDSTSAVIPNATSQ